MVSSSLLYNAPYSPQLNPIELVFSIIKKDVKERGPQDLKSLISNTISVAKKVIKRVVA